MPRVRRHGWMNLEVSLPVNDEEASIYGARTIDASTIPGICIHALTPNIKAVIHVIALTNIVTLRSLSGLKFNVW